MDDKEIIIGWVIDGDCEGDWAWDTSSITIPPPQHTFLEGKKQYQQGRNQCVLYSVLWCTYDNLWIDHTDIDIQAMVAMLPNYGFNPDSGMYLGRWWDLVCDYYNEKGKNIKKQVVPTYSDMFWDMLKRWYSLQFGANVDKAQYTDTQQDGDIDLVFSGKGTGHSRRIFLHTNGNYYIVDNYIKLLKYNLYEVTPAKLQELVNNRKLFNSSFIYYSTDTMKTYPPHNEGKTQDEKNIVQARKDAIDKWAKTLFATYQDSFYMNKMQDDIAAYRARIAYND